MKKPKRLWAVMKAHRFDGIMVNDIKITMRPGDPIFFIPVFGNKSAAIKWHGSRKNIVEATLEQPDPRAGQEEKS